MEVYSVKMTGVLPLGKQGENLVRQIQFDLSHWNNSFGPGTVQLLHQRSGDETPYPVAMEQEGERAIWTVTNADTATAGTGRAELQYYVGDALAKSETWMTKVLAALGPASETPPEAQQGWVDQVLAEVARITGMTAQAVELPAGAAPTADYADGVLTIGIPLGGDVSETQITQAVAEYLSKHPIAETDPTVPDWAKEEKKPSYTAAEVGADPSGTAAAQVSAHNTETTAHRDIRLLVQGLTDRLNALADSDDTTLDQLSEIVSYTKSNRELIAAVTTDKVSVTDIVNDLVTNVANKPLSAAQGVELKALIDSISEEIDCLKTGSTTIALSGWTYGYVTEDGGYSAGGTGCTSDYVEISAGYSYTIMYPATISAVRFAIYDSEKNYVSRIIDGIDVYNAAADGYLRITAMDSSGSISADAFSDVHLSVKKTSSSVNNGSSGGSADYTFLSGLKYYALGDSIVDYQGTTASPETYSGTDLQGTVHTDETVEGYIQTIEKRYSLVCTNYGVAGHTIVDDYSMLMSLDYSDVALVTIAYGANDARTSVPLGTVNDTDGTTFAGALNNILRKIYTDNPECRVLVLTPLQRLYVSNFGIATANANGNYLIDFVNMCKKVAEKRSTVCVDMYRASSINQTNLGYYTRDGVHPLNTGYLRMTGAIIPVLDGLFAIEYIPFGTMTNTGDTEQDEPETGNGGDSGGEDTPPTEDAGETVVQLTDDMFVNDGTIIDNYGTVYDTGKGHSYTDPIELVAGKTYTLTMPSASRGEVYSYVTCNSPDFSTHTRCTTSWVDTGDTATSSNNEVINIIKVTIVVQSTGTYYLWINKRAGFEASDISLSYL